MIKRIPLYVPFNNKKYLSISIHSFRLHTQEDNAETMADNLEYPTMDELSEQVNEVINHFSIVRYVGIGVGLGKQQN